MNTYLLNRQVFLPHSSALFFSLVNRHVKGFAASVLLISSTQWKAAEFFVFLIIKYIKIISLFFHLPVVVWTTRWAIVKICSAIVRISSEPVEISSELVEISSEPVLRSSELLIISVFRKTPQSVPYPPIPPCHEAKGEPVHFYLYSSVC